MIKASNYIIFTQKFGHFSSISLYDEIEDSSKRSFPSGDKRVSSERVSHLGNYNIDLVDADTWQISSGLVGPWKGRNKYQEPSDTFTELVDENVNVARDDLDYDEIDDMRVQGKLFYKIDRGSKEYEEYTFDFHRSKKSNTNNDKEENEKNIDLSNSKQKEVPKVIQKKQIDFMRKNIISSNYEMGNFGIEKVVRTPTFNQLTAPYHEPFCLDIYISKGSVRACIVHRATSNVVAVAHSISKDMKFDYSSKKNATTCAAVGELLAQRALADDIHNVVYTPRRDEKVEGKLQIVLQSIIDNGIIVNVKIKQRKVKRFGRLTSR